MTKKRKRLRKTMYRVGQPSPASPEMAVPANTKKGRLKKKKMYLHYTSNESLASCVYGIADGETK